MKIYPEKEYLSLSALQHMLFCKRQCALIHIEQLWVENKFTAEGRVMHERVDRGDQMDRGRMRIEYSLPLKSKCLGISGKADVVEFHRQDSAKKKWMPFPVEYKRGKPKKDLSDKVQLCAQAMCLEEMLDVSIAAGALFYGKTRRRLDVTFDDDLRGKTIATARELHDMISIRCQLLCPVRVNYLGRFFFPTCPTCFGPQCVKSRGFGGCTQWNQNI